MARMLSIRSEDLRILLGDLASKNILVAPVERSGYFELSRLRKAEEICLDYTNTRLPPKRFFLPERQLVFKHDPKKDVTEEPCDDFKAVLFGVRPCDASALSVLDSILLKPPYRDPFYENRRKSITVISLSCTKPMEECFCNVFETGPVRGLGEDLTLTPMDKIFAVEIRTSKGLALVEEFRKLFTEADGKLLEEYEKLTRKLVGEMNNKIRIDREKLLRLEKEAEEAFFQGNAQRCIECSICSFTCPLCYCFESEDCLEKNSYARFRGWDTCISPFFTRMASGLDPRAGKPDRLLHRFCHKLSRIPLAFNAYGCVGCGRCVSLCPVGIDIREVLRKWG